MDWQHLATFNITRDWQVTQSVTGRDFKLTHALNNPNRTKIFAMIALVDLDSIGIVTEIFKPQRIQPYLEPELIQLPSPPENWNYRVGVKQLVLPGESLVNWIVKIDMPAYSLIPSSGNYSNNISPASTITVDNTKSVTLSAATVGKFGSLIINNSSKAKLYISLGTAASLTNYVKALGYLESYETPFNWSGDVLGIWDKADTTGNAKVYDFS